MRVRVSSTVMRSQKHAPAIATLEPSPHAVSERFAGTHAISGHDRSRDGDEARPRLSALASHARDIVAAIRRARMVGRILRTVKLRARGEVERRR